MSDPTDQGPATGSVAEEMAALAEALRSRAPKAARGRTGSATGEGAGADPRLRHQDSHDPQDDHHHDTHNSHHGPRHGGAVDACEICPVCRTIAALHTVSPSAVSALADLAHQAEVTLRALAVDLQRREESGGEPTREDIPVEDLDTD